MTKVETYSSFEEKVEYFEQINIKTKYELDQIISKYPENDKNELYFRGCNEAYYKLFNTAQRSWISNEPTNLGFTYDNFIKNEIRNARNWQGNLLEKFFSAFGQLPNDLIMLGFLQHYGAPTTLLDWTYSFNNSLFFATDRVKYNDSENEIENYISIYIIDNVAVDFDSHLENLIHSLDLFKSLQESLSDENRKELMDVIEKWGSLNYQDLINMSIISLVPGYQKDGYFHKNEELSFKFFYNQQNLNIINQKGFFIFNPSEDKPLEYFCCGKPLEEKGRPVFIPKITCLNIHKSLLKYVKKHLNNMKPYPINKEFIYPQEEFIAKNSFRQMLNFE